MQRYGKHERVTAFYISTRARSRTGGIFFFRVVSLPESEVNVENVRIAQPESKSSLIGLNYCDLDD